MSAFVRRDDLCLLCDRLGHFAPECIPCPLATHCVRRGPHESCLYDHSRPGGVWYRDPFTGKSPLDIALEAQKEHSDGQTLKNPRGNHE